MSDKLLRFTSPIIGLSVGVSGTKSCHICNLYILVLPSLNKYCDPYTSSTNTSCVCFYLYLYIAVYAEKMQLGLMVNPT